jgi:hypothetical protein
MQTRMAYFHRLVFVFSAHTERPFSPEVLAKRIRTIHDRTAGEPVYTGHRRRGPSRWLQQQVVGIDSPLWNGQERLCVPFIPYLLVIGQPPDADQKLRVAREVQRLLKRKPH